MGPFPLRSSKYQVRHGSDRKSISKAANHLFVQERWSKEVRS